MQLGMVMAASVLHGGNAPVQTRFDSLGHAMDPFGGKFWPNEMRPQQFVAFEIPKP